jgi:putative tryptophan/tyrosine transport system substrate-binding protein
MTRREFITLLGSTVVVWPFAARAQQPVMPVIGFINAGSAPQWAHLVASFRKGLQEVGYTEGQNVVIEYRWAEGQYDRLPTMAVDLVLRRVTVIASGGGDLPALAAMEATKTIPIVFTSGGDPIKSGLVESLNRPGGNVTGVGSFTLVTGSKRLGMLHELIHPVTVAVFSDPQNPSSHIEMEDLQSTAKIYNQRLLVLDVTNKLDIDSAFDTLRDQQAGGLLVPSGALLTSQREKIVELAARHAVPTIYAQREFVDVGGLMSYGVSFPDVYRQLGVYTGRVLKGEKPADLPVLQPTKFEFIINLKTAKALGLEIPPTLLALADNVIE